MIRNRIIKVHNHQSSKKGLNIGKFPKLFKISTVIPIYKGKDKADVSNCIPVSFFKSPHELVVGGRIFLKKLA